jgi:hypothetical protein
LASLTFGVFALGGCGSSEGSADYNKDIVITPEQKVKMEQDMKDHPAPGAVDPKSGVPGQQ